ncbi:MAG: ACT domain-containing protein [Lachnospiraceae bacterium]|nr:ACT domain-containing protein [Lachnospiraceae bacterium]
MALTQLSVFVENKTGNLAEIVKIIADAGINLRALSLAETSEFGILRLITSDSDKAEKVLKERVIVKKTDVIAAKLDDQTGGLYTVLNILDKAAIGIEYIYAFTAPHQGAYTVLRVDNCAAAEMLLNQNGIETLKDSDISAVLD